MEIHYSLNRVKNNIVHFLSGKVLSAVAGLLVTVILARELIPAVYAVYSVLLGLTLIAGTLSSFAVENTAQRFIPELIVKKQKSQLFSVVLGILIFRLFTLLVTVYVFWAISPWIANLFAISMWLSEIRMWAIVIFFMSFFQFTSVLLEVFLMQKASKWIWIMTSYLRLFLILIFTSEKLTLLKVIYIEVISNGIGVFCSLAAIGYFFKDYGFTYRCLSLQGLMIKRIIDFSFFNYLRNSIQLLAGQATNRLVIAKFMPTAQIATFGFSQSLSNTAFRYMPSFFLRNLIRPVMMAHFSENSNDRELNTKANFVFKFNCMFFFPLLIWLSLTGDQIATLLSAGKYTEGWILLLLFGLVIVQDHYTILESHLSALEENRLLFYASFIPAFFLIPAVILVQKFGIFGLILARFVGVVLRDLIVTIILTTKGFACGTDWKGICKLCIAAILPVLLLFPTLPVTMNLFQMAMYLIISTLAYIFLLFFINPFNAWEKNLLNKISGKNLFKSEKV